MKAHGENVFNEFVRHSALNPILGFIRLGLETLPLSSLPFEGVVAILQIFGNIKTGIKVHEMSDTGIDSVPSLSIPEELLLLSMDDEQGRLVSSDSIILRFVLAGAILDELVLRKLVEIQDGKVVAWTGELIGDPILDPAIERLARKNKIKKLSYWIQQLAKDYRNVRTILLEKMVALGALREESHYFLWVFPYDRYPTNDIRIEAQIRNRIYNSLFGGDRISSRDAVILSLISASRLEVDVFGPEYAQEARERIVRLRKQYGIGSAVTNAILSFDMSL